MECGAKKEDRVQEEKWSRIWQIKQKNEGGGQINRVEQKRWKSRKMMEQKKEGEAEER